jgi:hypothetical protein
MDISESIGLKDKLSLQVGKNIRDEIGITANVLIELFGPDGKLKEKREIHNTVTTAGREDSADQLILAPTKAKPGWMEVGTGTPTATLLGAFIAGSRTALSSKTRLTNVVTMICTFGPGVGNGNITEAGIFNVVTENTIDMYVSANFGVITKPPADSLQITWTLTFN